MLYFINDIHFDKKPYKEFIQESGMSDKLLRDLIDKLLDVIGNKSGGD